MTTYVGLLRAVNLGPTNRVAMADLSKLLTAAGMHDVRTALQSGNVVFRGESMAPAVLERTLEAAARKRLGLKTDVFVRTAAEWADVIAANPFGAEATRDPGHLLAVVLKDEISSPAVAALQSAIAGREVVRAGRRVAYVVYPDGVGRSRLTLATIERALGTSGTARNWNTVLKLGALARR